MALAENTAAPSVESECSKSLSHCSRSDPSAAARGLWAEERVQHVLQKKGYECVGHRVRTPFGEIDIIAKTPQKVWVLIEVKTVGHPDFLMTRISKRQRERLKNCRSYWQSQTQEEVEFLCAFVDRAGEVLIVEDVIY